MSEINTQSQSESSTAILRDIQNKLEKQMFTEMGPYGVFANTLVVTRDDLAPQGSIPLRQWLPLGPAASFEPVRGPKRRFHVKGVSVNGVRMSDKNQVAFANVKDKLQFMLTKPLRECLLSIDIIDTEEMALFQVQIVNTKNLVRKKLVATAYEGEFAQLHLPEPAPPEEEVSETSSSGATEELILTSAHVGSLPSMELTASGGPPKKKGKRVAQPEPFPACLPAVRIFKSASGYVKPTPEEAAKFGDAPNTAGKNYRLARVMVDQDIPPHFTHIAEAWVNRGNEEAELDATANLLAQVLASEGYKGNLTLSTVLSASGQLTPEEQAKMAALLDQLGDAPKAPIPPQERQTLPPSDDVEAFILPESATKGLATNVGRANDIGFSVEPSFGSGALVAWFNRINEKTLPLPKGHNNAVNVSLFPIVARENPDAGPQLFTGMVIVSGKPIVYVDKDMNELPFQPKYVRAGEYYVSDNYKDPQLIGPNAALAKTLNLEVADYMNHVTFVGHIDGRWDPIAPSFSGPSCGLAIVAAMTGLRPGPYLTGCISGDDGYPVFIGDLAFKAKYALMQGQKLLGLTYRGSNESFNSEQRIQMAVIRNLQTRMTGMRLITGYIDGVLTGTEPNVILTPDVTFCFSNYPNSEKRADAGYGREVARLQALAARPGDKRFQSPEAYAEVLNQGTSSSVADKYDLISAWPSLYDILKDQWTFDLVSEAWGENVVRNPRLAGNMSAADLEHKLNRVYNQKTGLLPERNSAIRKLCTTLVNSFSDGNIRGMTAKFAKGEKFKFPMYAMMNLAKGLSKMANESRGQKLERREQYQNELLANRFGDTTIDETPPVEPVPLGGTLNRSNVAARAANRARLFAQVLSSQSND